MLYDHLFKSTGKAHFSPPARRALRDARITTLGIFACLSPTELLHVLGMDREMLVQVTAHAWEEYDVTPRGEEEHLYERALKLYGSVENPPVALLLFMNMIEVEGLEYLENQGITTWGEYRQIYGPLFFE